MIEGRRETLTATFTARRRRELRSGSRLAFCPLSGFSTRPQNCPCALSLSPVDPETQVGGSGCAGSSKRVETPGAAEFDDAIRQAKDQAERLLGDK